MQLQKSIDHISFVDQYEYFWSTDSVGKRVVVAAPISSPLDPTTKQRIGARFEGTEAWFKSFGSFLMPQASDIQSKL